MSLTLWQNKGSRLTIKEVDDNWLYLEGAINDVVSSVNALDLHFDGASNGQILQKQSTGWEQTYVIKDSADANTIGWDDPLFLKVHKKIRLLGSEQVIQSDSNVNNIIDFDSFGDKLYIGSPNGITLNSYSGGSIGGDIRTTTTGAKISYYNTTEQVYYGAESNGLSLQVGSDATGDIYYRGLDGFLKRLGIGSTDQVLKVASGLPVWGAAGGSEIVEETINTTGTTTLDFSFDSFAKITQTGSIVIQTSNSSGTKIIEKTFLIQGSTNPAHTFTFPTSWKNISGVSADSTKMNLIQVNLINDSIVFSVTKYDIPDTTAPVLLKSSILLEALNTIELLYSEAIDSSVTTQTSWYSITGKTVTSVTILSNKVRVVVSVAFTETDTPNVTFTNQVVGNGIQDAFGNKAADFSQTIGLTTYRLDTFNRANSTVSINSPSDGGSNWVTPFGAVWGIDTNKAYCFGANTTTNQANALYIESSESNVIIRAKFTFGTVGAASNTSFLLRYIDTNNYYLAQLGKTIGGDLFYSVFRVFGGVTTALVSSTNYGTWVNGTQYTFMVKFSGNTMTLYNNTTSLVQVVDSLVVGTKHGLRLFSGASTSGNTDRFDDFGVYYG